MISKIQPSSCVAMDETKKTNKENSKLRADIKATQNSIKKLRVETRKVTKDIRVHFGNENENRKKEHAQLVEYANTTSKNLMTTSKNLMMESNHRVAAVNNVQNYILSAEASIRRDIESVMKTAKTSKQKLDNTDINKFGDRPS